MVKLIEINEEIEEFYGVLSKACGKFNVNINEFLNLFDSNEGVLTLCCHQLQLNKILKFLENYESFKTIVEACGINGNQLLGFDCDSLAGIFIKEKENLIKLVKEADVPLDVLIEIHCESERAFYKLLHNSDDLYKIIVKGKVPLEEILSLYKRNEGKFIYIISCSSAVAKLICDGGVPWCNIISRPKKFLKKMFKYPETLQELMKAGVSWELIVNLPPEKTTFLIKHSFVIKKFLSLSKVEAKKLMGLSLEKLTFLKNNSVEVGRIIKTEANGCVELWDLSLEKLKSIINKKIEICRLLKADYSFSDIAALDCKGIDALQKSDCGFVLNAPKRQAPYDDCQPKVIINDTKQIPDVSRVGVFNSPVFNLSERAENPINYETLCRWLDRDAQQYPRKNCFKRGANQETIRRNLWCLIENKRFFYGMLKTASDEALNIVTAVIFESDEVTGHYKGLEREHFQGILDTLNVALTRCVKKLSPALSNHAQQERIHYYTDYLLNVVRTCLETPHLKYDRLRDVLSEEHADWMKPLYNDLILPIQQERSRFAEKPDAEQPDSISYQRIMQLDNLLDRIYGRVAYGSSGMAVLQEIVKLKENYVEKELIGGHRNIIGAFLKRIGCCLIALVSFGVAYRKSSVIRHGALFHTRMKSRVLDAVDHLEQDRKLWAAPSA